MQISTEDRWTAPRLGCPHPERWHSFDPQTAELEVVDLVGAMVRALQPDYVIETGTAVGVMASSIGAALRANGQGRLDTIEIDPERVVAARQACVGMPVTVIEGSSLEFTPDTPIGFAWFDSLPELRVAEFNRYRAQIVPGSIVGFHDTGEQFGAWSNAIRSLPGCRTVTLPTPRGVTFVEVFAP